MKNCNEKDCFYWENSGKDCYRLDEGCYLPPEYYPKPKPDIKQRIIDLIEGEIKREKIKYSDLLKSINDKSASILVKKAFSNSLYHSNELQSLLTKIESME